MTNILMMMRGPAELGFFAAMGAAMIFILRMLDERQGRQLSAVRLLLFPFFISRDALTARGRGQYGWFLLLWTVGAFFWVVLGATILFAR